MTAVDVITGILIGVVAAAILWRLARVWGGFRVRRWCRKHGYELILWDVARFYEGPRKWLRTDNEEAYYIEVRDRMGLVRAGYLTYGTWWSPFARQGEVHWD